MGKVIAIRGATTAESNTKDSIVEATKEMLEELVSANDLDVKDIICLLYTSPSPRDS